jgi:hypothetical protein
MGASERKRRKRIKQYVIDRDGAICCYCDFPLIPEEITLEHIVPDSFQGTFNSTNLTIACAECNSRRGNKPFFEYCMKYNFSDDKLEKYKKLYYNNLRIKVLNISKEECLQKSVDKDGNAIPTALIKQACKIMNIKNMDFTDYENYYNFDIKFNKMANKKEIKWAFEQLIRIIEADSV